MGRPVIILRCPLVPQEAPSQEGYMRAMVSVPLGAGIIFLGSEPPNNEICLWVATPLRPVDPATGQPKAFAPNETQLIEFIIVSSGAVLDPEEYVLRTPVRTDQGMIFLWEKKPKGRSGILVAPGGGKLS